MIGKRVLENLLVLAIAMACIAPVVLVGLYSYPYGGIQNAVNAPLSDGGSYCEGALNELRRGKDHLVDLSESARKRIEICTQLRMAIASEESATISRWQMFLGASSLIFVLIATVAASIAAIYSGRQAEASSAMLRAMERPWISIELRAHGDLYTDMNEWIGQFEVAMKNVGSSPSLNVTLDAEMHAKIDDPVVALKALVERARRGHRISQMIFPNEQAVHHINICMKTGDVVAAAKRNFLPGHVRPTIIGCCIYDSAITKETHQTGFVYELRRSGREAIWVLTDGRVSGVVPGGRIDAGDQEVFQSYISGTAD